MYYFTKYEDELAPKYDTSVPLEEHVKKAVHYYEVLKCKFGNWKLIAEAREQYDHWREGEDYPYVGYKVILNDGSTRTSTMREVFYPDYPNEFFQKVFDELTVLNVW